MRKNTVPVSLDPRTMQRHRSELFEKKRNRAELRAMAFEYGIALVQAGLLIIVVGAAFVFTTRWL